jgi:hypothetical protein
MSRFVPHYKEPIAIRSATQATHLVGFYVAYCKHCNKKSFASPFSGITQFYAGLTFSKEGEDDIGTLKQGLKGHTKADLKVVETVESPARAHQAVAVNSENTRRRHARQKEEWEEYRRLQRQRHIDESAQLRTPCDATDARSVRLSCQRASSFSRSLRPLLVSGPMPIVMSLPCQPVADNCARPVKRQMRVLCASAVNARRRSLVLSGCFW